MLPRRTAPCPRAARPSGRRRSPLGRALPALALGVTAVALAASTALPASASPRDPALASARHLTAAAEAAGLEPGNATMGWRARGTGRTLPAASTAGVPQRSVVLPSSTSGSFTPAGVLGVDVSGYQGRLSWSTWTRRDRDFAYIKATEGTSYRNPYFKYQYGRAKTAGLIRGAYHFAAPDGRAGYRQARYFVANGGGWSPDGKTLPGVLDVEYNPYGATCYGLSKKNMVRWISSFTVEYKRLTGKDAVIYTTADWWNRCTGGSTRFAGTNPLWVARYGTTTPGVLPKGWTFPTFWQYSTNPIDQDVFPSRLQRLKVLATRR